MKCFNLNKKGFTLVELLAVIVVLALLMIVAGSSIGTALKNSKISATKTEAQKLLKSLYEENFSKIVLGENPSGYFAKYKGEFSYTYDVNEKGEIPSFCLKHKDGIYIIGKIDASGKPELNEYIEKNPNCSIEGYDGESSCLMAGGEWTEICP